MKRPARMALLVAGLLLLTFLAQLWRLSRLESSQDRRIVAAARKHGVPPALIKAVIWRESRFDPKARGSKGETGLMQIMEDTGLEWAGAQRVPLFSRNTLMDPEQNIECGTWYLRKLLGRYTRTDNPLPYALADYNAGRGNVLRWLKGEAATNSASFIEQIGFPSTKAYVQAVLERRAKYEPQFTAASR